MALHASEVGACVCIALIINLLVRHPSCDVLVNQENKSVESDPYLGDEEDPAKTNALESSLWEIKVG